TCGGRQESRYGRSARGGGEIATMRNASLHAALRDFALEAASALMQAVEEGDELGYDVAEEPGAGPILYRYRALTAEYIGAHWQQLAQLPALEPAARELG